MNVASCPSCLVNAGLSWPAQASQMYGELESDALDGLVNDRLATQAAAAASVVRTDALHTHTLPGKTAAATRSRWSALSSSVSSTVGRGRKGRRHVAASPTRLSSTLERPLEPPLEVLPPVPYSPAARRPSWGGELPREPTATAQMAQTAPPLARRGRVRVREAQHARLDSP